MRCVHLHRKSQRTLALTSLPPLPSLQHRDVWKGIALAVNYALYNEVATEALFSAQVRLGTAGHAAPALQVAGVEPDVSLRMHCLAMRRHVPRMRVLRSPAASLPDNTQLPLHPTKQTVQGAAQLDADLAAMAAVFGEYTSRPAAHFRESREACRLLSLPWSAAAQLAAALEAQPRAAKQLLAPHGVKALNAEQASLVLGQRLDLLTARPGSAGAPGVAAAAAAAAAAQPAAAVGQAAPQEQYGYGQQQEAYAQQQEAYAQQQEAYAQQQEQAYPPQQAGGQGYAQYQQQEQQGWGDGGYGYSGAAEGGGGGGIEV